MPAEWAASSAYLKHLQLFALCRCQHLRWHLKLHFSPPMARWNLLVNSSNSRTITTFFKRNLAKSALALTAIFSLPAKSFFPPKLGLAQQTRDWNDLVKGGRKLDKGPRNKNGKNIEKRREKNCLSSEREIVPESRFYSFALEVWYHSVGYKNIEIEMERKARSSVSRRFLSLSLTSYHHTFLPRFMSHEKYFPSSPRSVGVLKDAGPGISVGNSEFNDTHYFLLFFSIHYIYEKISLVHFLIYFYTYIYQDLTKGLLVLFSCIV